MGIKGLLSYIKSQSLHNRLPLQPLASGSHLLIDGNGYVFALLQYLNDQEMECSYAQFRNIITRELEFLQIHLGLCVTIFFDGPDRRLKADTDHQRNLSRMDTWIELSNIFAHNKPWSRSQLPLPVLLHIQMKICLSELGVHVICCDGEADQEMALVCSHHRAQGLASYCYAEDSDFWCMKDIGYIKFADLTSAANSDANFWQLL